MTTKRVIAALKRTGSGQTTRMYDHGGKIEDKTGPESEAVEVEAHESEYLLCKSTADALGQEFLDAVNEDLQDPNADPLFTLIEHVKLLPEASNEGPANGQDMMYGYEVSPQMFVAFGQQFLDTLQVFLRMHPGKPEKAVTAAATKLPSRKKKFAGGGLIGDKPARV